LLGFFESKATRIGGSMARSRRQRGTGTVIEYRQKNGDTSYRIQFVDAGGKQVKETVGRASEGWNRSKVEKHLRERVSAVEQKGWKKPKPLTFAEYADRWLTGNEKPRGWTPATVRAYRLAVDRLKERFGRMKLGDIRRPDINEFSSQLLESLSARSVNLTLTVLHMILESAELEELIDSNPARKINRPKNPRYKPRVLTMEEARRVEKAFTDPQCRFAFLVFELLGIRFKELRGLRWRDIEFNEKRLRIEDSKTPEGERWLAIPTPLVNEFAEHFKRTHYKTESDFVFGHPLLGSRWHEHYYRDAMHAALKEAGITDRFRPAHDLRVTSLTSGVLANEHPARIMQRAGHKNYETTKGYISLAGQVSHEDAERIATMRLGG
jgi:integrase